MGVLLTRRWRPAGSMTGSPRTAQRGGRSPRAACTGFDLTFAAPKSVSLLRARARTTSWKRRMQAAHHKGIDAAMTYLHEHAGYTRVHNPRTGRKDLQRLPGLVGDRLSA